MEPEPSPLPLKFRLGTSSWSAKGWVGPFYPPGTKPGAFLAWYATQFDTVEADTTYYRLPTTRLVDGWDRALPEGFELSAKFPRTIVHAGEGARPDAETVLVWDKVGRDAELFVERMSRLGSKLGALVLQFPYFNKQAFESAGPFLERLDHFLESLPRGPKLAVEIRNKAWIQEPLLECLRRHGVALCLVDLLYMPHPDTLSQRFDLFTADFTYVRLIGDRKAVDQKTKTFDRIVLDQDQRLDRWAAFLKEAGSVPEAYVYANNHFAGHGPSTIRELAQRLDVHLEGPGGPPTPRRDLFSDS